MNRNQDVLIFAEVAILTAVAIVLDVIANWLQFTLFPNGGSISITMLPIFVIAFRRGLVPALTVGILMGTLQTIFGAYFLSPVQYLFDYPIPYMLVGFAGVSFRFVQSDNVKTQNIAIVTGVLLGGLLRYASHVYAGIKYWGEYSEWSNATAWSFFYNATYMVPSIILCAIIAVVINITARMIYTKEIQS